MMETTLHTVAVQSALICGAAMLIAMLRPLLLRLVGAGAAYAVWMALPLMSLAAAMPRPAVAPIHVILPAGAWSATPQVAAAFLPAAQAWAPALLAMWCSGAILCATLHVLRLRRYLRALRREGAHWRSPAGTSPALLGLWKARLVLPTDFEQRFDAREQTLILAHEQMHRLRGDNAWNLLATLLATLHWFNPLAWWALRRMRADQELSCDAAVIAHHPHSRADYARALAKSQGHDDTATWVANWFSVHPLIERVYMLKQHSTSVARRRIGLALAACLVLSSAGAVYAGLDTASAQQGVDIRMKVRIDGKESSPRLIAELGQTATVGIGSEGAERARWTIAMTTTRDSDGRLRILTRFGTGWPVRDFSTHTQIAASEGDPITVDVGDSTTPQPLHFERVVKLVELPTK